MGELADPAKHFDLAVTYRGRSYPVRFVADKSLFHDAFRSEYERQPDAEWFWAYLVARRTVDPHHRILVTASSILTRLREELKGFPDVAPQVILAMRSITDVYPVPTDVPLDLAPLYVAKIIADTVAIASVVSSVKNKKWLERMKRAGVKWRVMGFDEGMSDKRAIQKAWFIPSNTHACSHVLEDRDPVYRQVIKLIGPPTRYR